MYNVFLCFYQDVEPGDEDEEQRKKEKRSWEKGKKEGSWKQQNSVKSTTKLRVYLNSFHFLSMYQSLFLTFNSKVAYVSNENSSLIICLMFDKI